MSSKCDVCNALTNENLCKRCEAIKVKYPDLFEFIKEIIDYKIQGIIEDSFDAHIVRYDHEPLGRYD